jgi:hypothetical protein
MPIREWITNVYILIGRHNHLLRQSGKPTQHKAPVEHSQHNAGFTNPQDGIATSIPADEHL